MEECPECGGEIDYLTAFNTSVPQVSNFFVKADGETEYEYVETSEEGTDYHYYCPKCNAFLFDNEEDAERFLKVEVE